MGDGDDPARLDQAEVGRIFREESGQSVATLIRVVGDIDLAEDAVQEAFAAALHKWPAHGLPPNPGGWITITARNRTIDHLRREARGRELLGEVAVLLSGDQEPGMPEEVGPVQDDRLRLIFTCCHPALSTQTQVALTLREPQQPHGRRNTWPPPPGLSRCWWTGQALDHRPGGHAGQHAQEPDSDRAGDAAHGTVPCLRTVADLLHRPP